MSIVHYFTKISGKISQNFPIYCILHRGTMTGLDTSWNTDNRVVHLKDVLRYLITKRRRVHHMPARSLYRLLGRRLSIQKRRMMRSDISIPIILVIDWETRRPTVVLDGNHRLAKAAVMKTDIPFRILYSDEYDMLFGI